MQNEESRLRSDTPERQDVDELVADGMDDEANVDQDGAGTTEADAIREIETDEQDPPAMASVSDLDERTP